MFGQLVCGGFQACKFWRGHIVGGCVLLSSAVGCIGTLIYSLSVLGTEEGHSYVVEVWQWGLWLQVCRWQDQQHGGDFGAVGLSIHNYSGATFVTWNYYKEKKIFGW